MPLGPTELIVVLLIIVVLFGAGRIADIGGALGKSIKEFRQATREDDVVAAKAPVANVAAGVSCPSCAKLNGVGQTFCGQCGTRLLAAVAA
jgi:sec-independent protein translocase protein TatA